MQISHSSPYEEYIRKKLYENFGDDIKEIS